MYTLNFDHDYEIFLINILIKYNIIHTLDFDCDYDIFLINIEKNYFNFFLNLKKNSICIVFIII